MCKPTCHLDHVCSCSNGNSYARPCHRKQYQKKRYGACHHSHVACGRKRPDCHSKDYFLDQLRPYPTCRKQERVCHRPCSCASCRPSCCRPRPCDPCHRY